MDPFRGIAMESDFLIGKGRDISEDERNVHNKTGKSEKEASRTL